MIAEVEGKPCVNFGEYDGGVYVCRRISGLEVDEDGCFNGTCEWADPEEARPGELTDGMAIGFDCLRARPRLVAGHLFRLVLRLRSGARGPLDGRGPFVGEGVHRSGWGQGLIMEAVNDEEGRFTKPTEAQADWRGELLSRLRALIMEADPEMTEERKWVKPTNPAGVPTFSHNGLVCTGETYKSVVKMTFAKGASLPDPSGLFNSSLEGNTRRAIDFREGDEVDEEALKALIRAAVALNTGG